MNPERKFDVILAPWITAKSTESSERNPFTFKVSLDSTNPQIKSGPEELFGSAGCCLYCAPECILPGCR